MEKTFKTVEEQLKILSNRDLIIDMDNADEILKTTNYYNLINGYNEPFLLKNNGYHLSADELDIDDNDFYLKGSKFSEIYNLYLFDKNISNLFFKYILVIENRIKSLIAYYFSEEHGHRDQEYLDIKNFSENIAYSDKLEKDFNYIKEKISKTISSYSIQPYLKHYLEKHGYIPLWVLVNSLTLGDINTFFKVLKEKTKSKISKVLSINKNIEPGELSDYIVTLSVYRNLLAHDERFYKYKKLTRDNRNYLIDFKGFLGLKKIHSSIFAIMIIFRALLEEKDFEEFLNQFIKDINELSTNLSTISINDILKEMNIISFVTLKKTHISIKNTDDIFTFFNSK